MLGSIVSILPEKGWQAGHCLSATETFICPDKPMRKHISIVLFTLFSTFAPLAVEALSAQLTNADLPYVCGFEDEDENAQWVLNVWNKNVKLSDNEWMMGTADAYMGTHSLYVSSNASSNTYKNSINLLTACRAVQLEKGQYDIAFDWRGMGNNSKGYLQIVLTNMPISQVKCLADLTTKPAWLRNAILLTDNDSSFLSGADSWRHYRSTFTIPDALSGRTLQLVMIWCNTDEVIRGAESVLIDNLQLAKASTTGYPEFAHVEFSGGHYKVLWEQTSAPEYDLLYRYLDSPDDWIHTASAQPELVFEEGISLGAYEIWVRQVVGSDTTVYTVIPSIHVYEAACFDALNMYHCTFETGTWNAAQGKMLKGRSRVDYGYQSRASRHTVHFRQGETDPRTNNQLRTIPAGEYGSVRLGNWDTGSQYESISFQYTVDEQSSAVLLLQYAMVLQNPHHSAQDQPRFYMTIYGENGKPIDKTCGQVDFHSPAEGEDSDGALWHVEEFGGGDPVYWQDWKTVGVNLENYQGQTLTVELTSYDCNQGGHYGYAYFTLNCTNSQMEGIPWGENSSTNYFTAPNGFEYLWWKDDEPDVVVSREQTLTVDEMDMSTYFCKVSYPTNSECYFVLEATGKPHTPKAEIEWEWQPENCTNAITVRNKSHVQLYNYVTGETEHRYDMRIGDILWTLPDGTQTNEQNYEGWQLPIADRGDTLVYQLRASVWVHNKEYFDTLTATIVVPAIGEKDTVLYDTICTNTSVAFAGVLRTSAGLYVDSLKSTVTGCDSLVYLDVYQWQPIKEEVYDTLCAGGSVWFGGFLLHEPGNYTNTVTSLRSGCDSVVTLHLFALSDFSVEMPVVELCADGDFMRITLTGTEYVDQLGFRIAGGEELFFEGRQAVTEMLVPLSLFKPGHHRAGVVAYQPWCAERLVPVEFDVNFSSSIVQAKWDNVLAILNDRYNGGYRFRSYQWYKDGQPIQGATGSWYHDDNMDMTALYEVDLQLEDGSHLRICPFTFAGNKKQDATPAAARKWLEEGVIRIEREGRVYDVMGNRLR